MWGMAFEESMLRTHENLIIHCPSEDLAETLMEILERNDIRWCGDELPTTSTKWDDHEAETCYWVESKELTYGDREYANEDPYEEHTGYIRCTFYGVEYPDFDTASENEILSLLGI